MSEGDPPSRRLDYAADERPTSRSLSEWLYLAGRVAALLGFLAFTCFVAWLLYALNVFKTDWIFFGP